MQFFGVIVPIIKLFTITHVTWPFGIKDERKYKTVTELNKLTALESCAFVLGFIDPTVFKNT